MNKLVGRQKELDTIDASLAALAAGQGGTLFLSGEPGIGKSALARCLAERAAALSLPVYWGFCWEAGGAPAYWPWTQSLRSLVAEQQVAESVLAKLRELLPEATGQTGQSPLQPDQARFLLLESTRQMLDQVSRHSPVVLVLEDLHAADTDSLHLLSYLAGHAAAMPVLLVGTYRELEARQSPAMEPLWRASRDAIVLQPAPLDKAAVKEFLDTQVNVPADAEQVNNLLATTEGNPLFLTELVSLLASSRDISSKLPATIQQVITQQIGLLPDDVADALQQASVLGREFDITVLSVLRNAEESVTELEIETAGHAGLVDCVQAGRYRFSHALHRDVLYQSLESHTRQDLHMRCARYIRALIEEGDEDRWSVYATHLQAAGPDYRTDAIKAWKMSARRAHARLAFDDTARSLQNALAIYGEGPRSDPAERCELQLHCAEALMLAGNIQAGQSLCREVFATARTLADPSLMSEAALTYGNALVIARVDKELIAILKESLDLLPEDDAATRARVQARLAAAMQPSLNPLEPMAMARDAIALARSTKDEAVLFPVLRSAISALMDFAPASQRIPLNREFEALAEKRGNVAGQFRSNLRLMIDAIETSDRQLMDESIDAAEQIANRIGLPHYQWRVASARATQAITEGRYAEAMRCVETAEQLATRADDLESRITLPLQRFVILCEWDDERATPLTEIMSQLHNAFATGMADAEFFVTPFVAAYTSVRDSASARQLLDNETFIERAFSGGDRISVSMIGEFAILAGYDDIARRAYDAIAERAGECASLGLMGCGLFRPVAFSLGVIAYGLGLVDEARAHLETALRVARAMRARPVQAYIHANMAMLEQAAGNESEAKQHSRAARVIRHQLGLREFPHAPGQDQVTAPATTEFSLRLDGDIRVITFQGKSTSLKNSKGLDLLAELVARPDKEIHVLDLVGAMPLAGAIDSGPQLDDQARAEYKQRVADLTEELKEADALGDAGRADALRHELDFITRELSRAYGLGGRKRRSGNAAERARVNVRRRIKDAIERIGEQLPDAGRYLINTIKTGSYCKYSPM